MKWCKKINQSINQFLQSFFSYELNYHGQKIRRTLVCDIRKHWTAVSTLLSLISSFIPCISPIGDQTSNHRMESDVGRWLGGEVSALHSVVAGSISSEIDHGITLLMRPNKVETAVQCFRVFRASIRRIFWSW